MSLNYTVVIRTVGTAGEKYQELLNSIERQTIRPKEVLIVLPEGFNPPPERLGWERFIYTPKGVVAQRSLCVSEIKTEYAIFFDDDLHFDATMLERLYAPIEQGRADVTFPIFSDFLPQGFKTRLAMALIGSAVPMIGHKKYFTRILKSGCYAYNPHITNSSEGEYLAETAPGLCFLMRVDDFKKLHFEDEMWLQGASYAVPDDQVMFYKLHLNGYRIIGLAGLDFIHLDAGSDSPGRANKNAYGMSRNISIFWHRFIYSVQRNAFGRFRVVSARKWHLLRSKVFGAAKFLLGKSSKELRQAAKEGARDAKLYIKSDTYRQLPSIYRKD